MSNWGQLDTDEADSLDRSLLFVLSKTIRTAWDELLIRRAPEHSVIRNPEKSHLLNLLISLSLEDNVQRRLTSQPNRSGCSFFGLELLRHKRRHSFQLNAAGRCLSGFTWVLMQESSVCVGSWTKGPVLLVFRTLMSAANLVHDVNNKPKLKISSYLLHVTCYNSPLQGANLQTFLSLF